MVEADSHLKLLPASMFTIYKVFENIDMLSIGMCYQPYTVILTLLGSDFWVCGNLWSRNDVIWSWLSHLKLLPLSILDKYNVFEHIDMLSMGIR
jgi:hypothetical protein